MDDAAAALLILDLRAFRHLFRHAYAVELKPERVRAIAELAARLRAPLESALDGFADAIVGGEA